MGPPPGDPMKLNEKLKEPKPKTLKEVPGYLSVFARASAAGCSIFSAWCGTRGHGSCFA